MATLKGVMAANAAYHEREGLSSSQVQAFVDDPVTWWHVHVKGDWEKPEPTSAMEFGNWVHYMVELGGPEHVSVRVPDGMQMFTSDELQQCAKWVDEPSGEAALDMIKGGKLNRQLKTYQTWKKLQLDAGKIIMPAGSVASIQPFKEFAKEHGGKKWLYGDEPNPLDIIWRNMQLNRDVCNWLDCESAEVEYDWQDEKTGLHLKCRLDREISSQSAFVDWKTTRRIKPSGFQREFKERLYAMRLAMYQRGYAVHHGGEVAHVLVGAIENKPPYRIWPYHIDPEWLLCGHEQLDKELAKIASFDIAKEMDKPLTFLGMPRYAKSDQYYELENGDE